MCDGPVALGPSYLELEERCCAAETFAKEKMDERDKAKAQAISLANGLAAAEARVAELEAALREIGSMCANGYYGPDSWTYAMQAKDIARRALAGGGK